MGFGEKILNKEKKEGEEGMKKAFDFYVTLSLAETAEKLKEGLHGKIVKAEILDEYQRTLPDGKEIRLMVFQKYAFMSNDRPILTVLLDELDGKTKVHLYGASGVGGALGIDWMEDGAEFAQKAQNVLKEYKVEESVS